LAAACGLAGRRWCAGLARFSLPKFFETEPSEGSDGAHPGDDSDAPKHGMMVRQGDEMTTRRSQDLAVPAPREPGAQPPANVRPFPFIVGPHIVLEIAQRQRERKTAKAVARRIAGKFTARILGKLFR